MVQMTSTLKNEMFQWLKENPNATVINFKEKYGLNSSQGLKYYTEFQMKESGQIQPAGRPPKPKVEEQQEVDEEQMEQTIVQENEPAPVQQFLQNGTVHEQQDDDEGIQCGGCGFVMTKLSKYCPNCGVELE